MKKLLVILMVVAMASFLFVGCLPSVTPEAEEEAVEEEEEEVVVPVSATPVLIDVQTSAGVSIITVTSTSTQYMNIAEVGSSILVTGTAPSESLVQIYLDDVAIAPAVAEAATSGLWSVAIAKSSLGDDGVKVLTAKITEVGLDEGEASNAATFTLDTVRPSATTLAATADLAGTGTLTSTITAGLAVVDASGFAAGTGDIAAGTWTIKVLALSTTDQNIEISDGTNATLYSVTTLATFNGNIPGVTFTFLGAGMDVVGSITTLVITNATAVDDRARILFSEEITNASAIAAANYAFTQATTAIVTVTELSYSDKYMYFSTFAATLVQGNTLVAIVDDVVDLAGNAMTTDSVLSTTIAAASATSLAP